MVNHQCFIDGEASNAQPHGMGNNLDAIGLIRRVPDSPDVLTRLLESCAAEFPTRGIPGVSARFMPHISINNMEVHVSLLFPLHGAINVADLNAALSELVPHCAQASDDSTQQSLLFGSDINICKPDPEAPVFWSQKMRRIPKSDYASIAVSGPLERSFSGYTLPCFPGEFQPYWPGTTGKGGEKWLPEPLHRCRKLFFDFVEERSPQDAQQVASGRSATAFLRVTLVLDLNVAAAFEQHRCDRLMHPEDMLCAMYPYKGSSENPKARSFALPLRRLRDALYDLIHGVMRVYYADLRRAMGLVPKLPVASVLPFTWQDALHVIRLSSMEIDRHLYSADAELAYCELKSQTIKWRQRQEEEAMEAAEDESKVPGNSQFEHSAFHSQYALHEGAESFSIVLHTAKNGSATPDVKMIVRLLDSHYIRVGLRLNGRNGICHHTPQNRKGPMVYFAGSWYTLPQRTNVTKTLNGFVDVALMSIFYTQEQYNQMYRSMDASLNSQSLKVEKGIHKIMQYFKIGAKPEELNRLAATLRAGKAIGMSTPGHLRRFFDNDTAAQIFLRLSEGVLSRCYTTGDGLVYVELA